MFYKKGEQYKKVKRYSAERLTLSFFQPERVRARAPAAVNRLIGLLCGFSIGVSTGVLFTGSGVALYGTSVPNTEQSVGFIEVTAVQSVSGSVNLIST